MLLSIFLSLSRSTVYFEENFDNDDWEQNWLYSRHRPIRGDSIMGNFRLSSGAYYGNQRAQRGLQTMDQAAWYQITSRLKTPFNTSGRDFVLQYTIRFENGYDCSGGYLKLLNSSLAPLKFHSGSPFLLMFGAEVCKPNRRKVHFLIPHNGSEHDNRHYVESFTDELTHAYSLVIRANRSYEVRLDGVARASGELNTDFELGGAELIPDPSDAMPADWDSRKLVADPSDAQPETWDDRPVIPDASAQQPADWREHIQGKWSAPLIANPDYLGPWKPKLIANPAYRGEWTPRMVPNPVYVRDESFGVFEDIAFVGIEVFQSKPGAIYDNILLTDDVALAEGRLRENFLNYREEEFTMYKRVQQDKAAEEELKKLRERENAALTDEDFYTSAGGTEEDSSSTTIVEPDDAFVFPSEDVTDPPSAADFEFPFDVKHNKYFLQREKIGLRKGSSASRRHWQEHRGRKQHEMELPEHRRFSDVAGDEAKY
jgi:calreticulin